MATTLPTKTLARFDDFEVNLSTGQIYKSGEQISVQEQPFQILRLLLEAAPELVSREQISSTLWPTGTFVDFELGINTAVRKLRHTLGDSVETPKYVQTLAKRGYRFIAPIDWMAKAQADTSAPSPPGRTLEAGQESGNQAARSRNLLFAVLITVVLLAVVAAVFRSKPAVPKVELTAVPFTVPEGSANFPVFSPDGEQIAFLWYRNGEPGNIYVQSVHGVSEPVRLTHLEGAMAVGLPPVWSPDGNWIAYGRFNPQLSDRQIELVLIPAPSGGREIVVDRLNDTFDGLAWSPDSRFLVFADRVNQDEPLAIFLLDRETSQRKRITSSPKGTFRFVGDADPVFDGEGRRVAFIRTMSVGMNEIEVLDLHTGIMQTIVHESSSPPDNGALAWDVEGKSLIYASDRSGIKRLWRVPEEGGTPEPLMVGEDASSVAVSRRGHRLAFAKAVHDSNVWRLTTDLQGKEVRTPLISSNRQENQAVYSPDDKKIAFDSDRSGFEEIWMAKSDGTEAVQLTHLNTHKTGSPAWSPDSQRIAFDSRAAGQGDIYVLGIEDAAPKRITSDGSDNSDPVWSADGKWIFFQSNRTGEAQIFKVTASGGPAIRVSQHGGGFLQRADEQKLYFLKLESGSRSELWEKFLPDGEERRVAGVPDIPSCMNVQVTGDGVYYTSGTFSGHLRYFDFSTQKVRELSTPDVGLDFGISVSKDGRSILYSQIDSASSSIYMVENFR